MVMQRICGGHRRKEMKICEELRRSLEGWRSRFMKVFRFCSGRRDDSKVEMHLRHLKLTQKGLVRGTLQGVDTKAVVFGSIL